MSIEGVRCEVLGVKRKISFNCKTSMIVRDGTYTENVDVNKDHLTIQTLEKFNQNASPSESGAEETIVQAANSNGHVFEVTADYVNNEQIKAKSSRCSSLDVCFGN